MSYHNITTPTTTTQSDTTSQRTTGTQGQVAPPGFHYMPDGTLMADSGMPSNTNAAVNVKTIAYFNMDLSILSANATTRAFSITGDHGAVFSLEIKDIDGKYYNFITKAFQTNKSGLYNKTISNGVFDGVVRFAAVPDTNVDRYDIFLFAEPLTTKHADHIEVRFGDGSIDINSSIGSNSLLMTKVLYQYPATTLSISPFSPQDTVEVGSVVADTISANVGSVSSRRAFSTSCSVTTAAKCYRIIKQPGTIDLASYVALTIGDAPIKIPGENEYPTATAAFTGDDVNGAVTSGAIVQIDADVAGNVVIGDKITTPVTTDTVNGARDASAVAVTMDAAVATKMAVGDQVTGNAALDAGIFTVASLDSTNVFSISSAVAIADGVSLTFSSKINRSLTTVLNLDPSEGTNQAKKFTMSQDIQFRDNAPLTFFNQKNYRWKITNQAHLIKPDMEIITNSTNLTADTAVTDYLDTTTVFADTEYEEKLVNVSLPAIDTLGIKPVITNSFVTTQAGSVIFDKQQKLALAGNALRIGGYGLEEVERISGWEVLFTDLKVVLSPISTTTTAVVSNSTSVPVTSRNGILDDVSVVSGVGINPAVALPTVDTGAGAVTGPGALVLTAAQTLEAGAVLTFSGAGQTATITGFVEIIKSGTANNAIYIDAEKLLSIT